MDDGVLRIITLACVAFGTLSLFAGAATVGFGLYVLGFVASVPLMGDSSSAEPAHSREASAVAERVAPETRTTDEALTVLRRRYARGELTDAQFDRKLDRLLGTESVEDAEEYVRRGDDETERGGQRDDRVGESVERNESDTERG